MKTRSNNGVVGLVLIGLGAGFAALGLALVMPVCASWSRGKLKQAFETGKAGVASGFGTAADALEGIASRAQSPLAEAAKAARHTTAIAAGAVESAAHYIREQVS